MKNLKANLISCCALSAALIVILKIAGIYPAGVLFELASGVSIGGVSWAVLCFAFRVLSSEGFTPFGALITASALFILVILHTILVTWFSFAAANIVMVLLFF